MALDLARGRKGKVVEHFERLRELVGRNAVLEEVHDLRQGEGYTGAGDHTQAVALAETEAAERGVELAYLYFQIPLMILVIAPAIDGLRREWREAASNLGASAWQYWRHVGIPVLLPSFLGAFILLFGNSFSAYATAYGIAANGISIIPITIGFYYSGNVVNDPHLAQALAFGMFAVLAVMMILYVPLQRRSARWMR